MTLNYQTPRRSKKFVVVDVCDCCDCACEHGSNLRGNAVFCDDCLDACANGEGRDADEARQMGTSAL